MNNTHSIRSRSITFNRDLTEDECQLVKQEMTKPSAVSKVEVLTSRIHVDYEFPTITMKEIWEIISRLFEKNCFSLFQRTAYSVLYYMEQNERDYYYLPVGQQHGIKYIYAHYYERRHKNRQNIHKKVWQKYGKDKRN